MHSKTSQHNRCAQPGTQHRTQAQKRRRKRPLPYIYNWERLAACFYELLYEEDHRLTLYVYRASEDGYVVRPWLHKCHPFWNLESFIRDEFGPGDYAIYIRRGETMLVAGIIGIG